MIALNRNRQTEPAKQKHRARQGALFAYFMVYLMLAGATTAAAGMLLHQMFRARTADVDRGNGVRQLLRIDRQLRTDWASASQHEVELNLLTLQSADQNSVVYSIDGDRVQRIVRSADTETQGSDRFQFPKGSILQFLDNASAAASSDEGASMKNGSEALAGIIFRLITPVPAQTPKSTTSIPDLKPAQGRLVEIFLGLKPTANGPSAARPTEVNSQAAEATQEKATAEDKL